MYTSIVSPTVAYYKSIRFMIRTNDHGPAHIHAIKDDCEAVIEIETGEVVRCHGFSKLTFLGLLERYWIGKNF